MPNPFRSSNPWIKATALSAAALTVSLGLCGLNFAAFQAAQGRASLQDNLTLSAFAEAAAIILCTLALFVSLVGLALSTLTRRLHQP